MRNGSLGISRMLERVSNSPVAWNRRLDLQRQAPTNAAAAAGGAATAAPPQADSAAVQRAASKQRLEPLANKARSVNNTIEV